MKSDTPSSLTIILELDVDRYEALDVNLLFSTLALFCNSYSLMHRENHLVVLVHTAGDCHVVFPQRTDTFVPNYHNLSVTLVDQLHKLLEEEAKQTGEAPNKESESNCFISKAFSTALCVINRQTRSCALQPRVLVIQFGKDRPINYNSMMNSIFSSQKLGVTIDALILSKEDSHIMQQACFLSEGLYIKRSDLNDALQLLHMHFLCDKNSRALLNQPVQKSIDFKANCFCHKRPVEFAHMCSVCLTLTCETADRCIVCDTKWRT